MSKKFWLGLLLIVVSYLQWLMPKSWFMHHHFVAGCALTFFVTMFFVGVILLCGGISDKFKGAEMFGTARRSRKELVLFILAAGVSGIVLEVFAQWLGKLWIYPFFLPWIYWIVLFPGFVFYWVTIVKSYMAAKAVIDDAWPQERSRATEPYYAFEPALYTVFGLSGIVALAYAIGHQLAWYQLHGGFTFDVIAPVFFAPPFHHTIIDFLAVWGIAEWGLYLRKSPSALRSMLHGYWAPTFAILLSAAALAFFMETQNVIHHHWIYTHWPWPDSNILGVPTTVFLTWPLHYILFMIIPGVIAPVWAKVFWAERSATLKK